MDRQTHCTGQCTVEKRFILCLGMQEVAKLWLFRDEIFKMMQKETLFSLWVSTGALIASAVGNMCNSLNVSNVYRKSQWQSCSRTWIQGRKEKQVNLKTQRSLSSCNGFIKEVSSPFGNLENLKILTIFDFCGHFSLGCYMNWNWGCEQEGKKVLDSSL